MHSNSQRSSRDRETVFPQVTSQCPRHQNHNQNQKTWVIPEREVVRTSEDNAAVLKQMLDWVQGFLAQSHADLGRTGAVSVYAGYCQILLAFALVFLCPLFLSW